MEAGRVVMLATGVTPLAAGAVIPEHAVMDGPALCPFRSVTGLPCPLCGATRAFVLFGHGDGRWTGYGAIWVLAAFVLIAVALIGWRPSRRLGAAGVGVAWAWALAHAAEIS